jgi:3-isopropylmalate dehydrogenase
LVTGRSIEAGAQTCLIGVLPGEGIGPEVIAASLRVLDAVERISEARFAIREGAQIGLEAELQSGNPLPDEVAGFCSRLFEEEGALLSGPGRGRFVYELRRRFELFCKLSPLVPERELRAAIHLKPEHIEDVDILVVREGCGGVYQGRWWEEDSPEGRRAWHGFSYTEAQTRLILEAAARLAARRRGRLAVVIKAEGAPSISGLWREVAAEVADGAGVDHVCLDVDLAAYRLLQEPEQLDVLAAPNLFGDVLSDAGGVLLGSRGLSYGGNFAMGSAAVYQTNHGAAMDLAGTDAANPVGQIFALAMLLRESFGLRREASMIESAVRAVWRDGRRTRDLARAGDRVVGTREMGELVAARVAAPRGEAEPT